MLTCKTFYQSLTDTGVGFYAGVPDSLLKEICACITELADENHHVITANEGAAIGLATGSFLATGNPSMVYMQNSGLGNAVNPLLSLADRNAYSIPMLLMIGWRGEPGVKDEPQHMKQGEVTLELLDVMGIPYAVLPNTDDEAHSVLQKMMAMAKDLQQPVAVVVRKNTFAQYDQQTEEAAYSDLILSREEALEIVLAEIDGGDVVVGTTGMISREIYECRVKNKQVHSRDFLTVGSMGHCSQIAMGIAMSNNEKKVYCIDGDGSVIMHMGSLGVIGQYKGGNLIHIVINNGKHDSVGGQPTVGFDIDIPAVAKACCYQESVCVDTEEGIRQEIAKLREAGGTALLEIRVLPGARPDLGRPIGKPIENKHMFMDFLRS
ncbi:MAG: phosphonopyruvate decarboxylase [Akkermansiaceae bacterium]